MEIPSTSLVLLTTCFIVVFFFVQKWLMTYKRFYDLAAKLERPPGFSCYPILGHIHHFTNAEAVIKIATSFKSPYGVASLGAKFFYFLNDADLIEACLTNDKCINKPHYVDVLNHIKGGIFMAKGNTWKNQRKLLNPGFKQRILNFYSTKFHKHDERFIHILNGQVGEVFDIFKFALKSNSEKFFECAMGVECGEQNDDLWFAFKRSIESAQKRIFSLVGSVDFLNNIIKYEDIYVEDMNTVNRITSEVVAKRRKIIEQINKTSEIDHVIDNDYEEFVFMDYVIQCINENKYEEKNLIPEVITFLYAGIDTGTTAFSSLCLCLGLYPEIQEKLYQEICQVLGDRPFHYTDFARFQYLHMVLKETLRLFPPAPVLHRQTSEDVKIGDHIFPKNSILQVNLINVQRSPKYYKNPLKFDPERFAPDSEAVKNRHRYAFVPFSSGKRNCIGERFAQISLVSTIAAVMKKFRFETTYKRIEDIRLEQKLTLSAVEGFPVRIYPR